jgi:hypothetical protein
MGRLILSGRGLRDVVSLDFGPVLASVTGAPVPFGTTGLRAFARVRLAIFIALRARLVFLADRSPLVFPGTTAGLLCVFCHQGYLLSKQEREILVKDVLDLLEQCRSLDIMPLDLGPVLAGVTGAPVLFRRASIGTLALIGGAIFIALRT